MAIVSPAPRPNVTEPRYDLDSFELQSAVDRFLAEHEPRDGVAYACYRVSGTDSAASIARTIEGTVFLATFGVGHKPERMKEAYGPYEEASTFYVSFDVRNRRPVGALRVIRDSPAGLMTLNDLQSGTLKRAKGRSVKIVRVTTAEFERVHHIPRDEACWDVGTVTVMPSFRRNRNRDAGASTQLYRALYTSAVMGNVKHLVSIIDRTPLRQMTRFLGIPFVPLAGTPPINYMDSVESQAVYGYAPEFYATMEKHRKSVFGRMARPLLEKLMDGSRGMDESLQFLSRQDSSEINKISINGVW
jgi:hypothetical protein